MITLKINGKKYTCPACYEELSTGLYQKILREWDPEKEIAERDYIKLFALLTETDFKDMVRSPENEQMVWGIIHWYVTQDFRFNTEVPTVFELAGKRVRVPSKFGALSAGQAILLRRRIAEAKMLEEGIAIAVAICLQPLIDEKDFSYDRACELEQEVNAMPITRTHPLGFFLLTLALKPGPPPIRTWSQTRNSLVQSLRGMWPKWLVSAD